MDNTKIGKLEDLQKVLDLFTGAISELKTRVSKVESDVEAAVEKLSQGSKPCRFDPAMVFQAAMVGACFSMAQNYTITTLLDNPLLLDRICQQMLKFATEVVRIYEQTVPEVVEVHTP